MKVGSLEIDLLANIVRLQKDLARAQNLVQASMSSIERSVQRAQKTLSMLGMGVGVAAMANQVITLSDKYTKFTAQLQLATKSQAEYGAAYDDVRRIAKTSQADIAAVGTLYARISTSAQEMGLTQQRVADITESVNLALKVSGATAEETASATLQLSQAFGSGVMRGEEFNAVNEAAPRIMKALAEGMGVPVGALRDLASEGKITSAVLANTLPQALEQLRIEAKNIQTISGAWTIFKNEILIMVGDLSHASGGVSVLSGALNFLADNIRTIAAVMGALALGKLAGWAAVGAQVVISRVTAAIAANTIAQDANNRSFAWGLALRRGGLGVMTALGGPIGLLTMALTAGVIAWQSWGNAGESEISKIVKNTNDIAEFRKEIEKLNAVSIKKAINDITKDLEKAQDTMKTDYRKFSEEMYKPLLKSMNTEDIMAKYGDLFNELRTYDNSLGNIDQRMRTLIDTISANENLTKAQSDALVDAASKYILAADNVSVLSERLRELNILNNSINVSVPNPVAAVTTTKKATGGGASRFARETVDIQSRITEMSQLIDMYNRYGIQAEQLTDGQKEIIKLEQQLRIAQNLRKGQISNAQIKELIALNEIRVEKEKILRVLEKEIELQKIANQAHQSLNEIEKSLAFEASNAGKNSEQRRIAIAAYEQEVEIRKKINQMASEGIGLTAEFIDKIMKESTERGKLAAKLEEARIASEKFYGAQRDLLDEVNADMDAFIVKLQAIKALFGHVNFNSSDANAALVNTDQDLFRGTSQARDAEIYGYQQMYQRIEQLRQENLINQDTADQLLMNQQNLNSQKLRQLEVDAAKFRLTAGSTSWADVQLAAISKVSDGFSTFTFGATEAMGNFCKSFTDGVADSLGKAVIESENLGDALNNVAKQALEGLISALIKAGIQYAITEAMGVSMSETTTAAHVAATTTQTMTSVAAVQTTSAVGTAAAGEQTAAWTPAATAASIGSFGTAAVIALGAIAAVMALSKGFKSGGYTGNVGIGEIAGVVHGKEFVNNATSTSVNYPYLEAMNRGVSFEELAFKALAPSLIGYQSGGYVGNAPSPSFKPTPMRAIAAQTSGSQISVNIENYGSNKEFDVDISEDRIRIIASDVAESVVKKRTPSIVSGQIRNPNSEVSKSLRNSTKTERRR